MSGPLLVFALNYYHFMSLFEDSSSQDLVFPTEPAFLVPVEVRPLPQLGEGHCGVFASKPIAAGTKIWAWTDRVQVIPHQELQAHIDSHFGENLSEIQIFLRQGFVLPKGEKGNEDDNFNSNPTDAGRFMNHSNNANCGPDGTTRDIEVGEEMTMDYAFHGNPQWYQDICKKYNVLTEAQVAAQARGE